MKIDITKMEEATFYEDDFCEVPPPDIIAYNELRSCADLFRMQQQGVLEVNPEFQRGFIWPGTAQSRFIDSLVKQLPIPSMCFALDYKRQQWIVIDGLQRMSTIIRFLKGADWNLADLEDIDPKIAGKSAAFIKDEESPLHDYYSRVENLTIPITVLRCDLEKRSHLEYLFTIFHRLNSGGMKLNNQEIRHCIYIGPLNSLLKELDDYPSWRKLNRMKPGEAYRFVKQEVILRFLAFSDGYEKYSGNLAKYLNDYMHVNRYAKEEFMQERGMRFKETVNILYYKAFEGQAPPRMSTTLLEAALVGISKNLSILNDLDASEVRGKYLQLTKIPELSEQSLAEGLSKRQRVIDRLRRAIEIFASQQ